jgi:GT2 family glycosyltransferase
MTPSQSVTTIIVTYNQKEMILAQIDRILTAKRPSFHLIVVDNASQDGTAEALLARWGQDKRFTLVRQVENRGGAGGFRRGVEEALKGDTPLFWLLDDDAIPQADALNELLKAARELEGKGEAWGALGSLIAQKENPHLVTETGGEISWIRGKLIAHNQNRPIEELDMTPFKVGHAAAASLLINREALETCGFFEDIFIHFDDVEWCYRLARRGYPVYTVPASVVHHPFKKGGTPGWIRYYDARNILLVYRRNHPLLLEVPLLRYWTMALVFFIRGEGKTARYILKGQRDFFRGRIALRNELL